MGIIVFKKMYDQTTKGLAVLSIIGLSFISIGDVYSSEGLSPFKAHSLKRLDVAGSEMVLFQLFLKNGDTKVVSKDDHIGVSQKKDLVSFYMDFHSAHPSLKAILTEKSYIRNKEKLNKLVSEVFHYQKEALEDSSTLSVQMKP